MKKTVMLFAMPWIILALSVHTHTMDNTIANKGNRAIALARKANDEKTREVREYRITNRELQTIDGFGASDAWSMQSVGLWPEKERTKVADWLFSMEKDEYGQPLGIGLSIWRFNIGAGSAEQKDNSRINIGTRTECFLNADGTYNWDKQQGQRNILRMAKERGCEKFLAFLNSPPVFYTKNGLATNIGRGGTFNLQDDKYDDFAHYLADVIEGIEKKDGILFDYICPVNEPDGYWNWSDGRQEGSPATNREIARVVRHISKEFIERGLNTNILVYESSDYRCMFATHMTDWQRGYGIQSFFNPDSTLTYVGDLPNVPKLVVGHSYWTNTPLESLHDYRCQLADTLKKYNVEYWQTETCIMSNDEEVGGASNFDFSINSALYTARIIHYDIAVAGARSWQWWRAAGGAIKGVRGNFKDGLLCIKFGNGEFNNHNPTTVDDKVGTAQDSKLLWALGNYSRFIRPGAIRLAMEAVDENGETISEGDTDPKGIMCSAYRNTNGSHVVVAINYADSDRSFVCKTFNGLQGEWNLYRTSDVDDENLKPVGTLRCGERTTLPARSITTFICEI